MGESFDDVLRHLLLIWLDDIISKKVDVRDLDPDFELDTEVQYSSSPSSTSAIEDDIMLVSLLRNRKRRMFHNNNNKPRKKRAKYQSNKIFFTHPRTGERTVMTYHYTVWWNNYCSNPQPDNNNWCKFFRQQFRMPYTSYLNLLEQIK